MIENQQDKIVHLVCTRFNLALHFECKKRFDSMIPEECPWLDGEWLEKRFEIFEKYTFESLKNQTNKDFTWLVMFHQDTPDKYKERIRKFQEKMPQFLPLFFTTEESVNITEIMRAYIIRTYEGCSVITTRIDNDDLVHETFIEKMQREGSRYKAGKEMKFLSFVNGLQYDKRDGQILKFDYPDNHFISLFTSSSKLGNHVLQYNHALIAKENIELMYERTDIPLWVEVIHGNNVSNALHWRFSTIRVPYLMKDEYNILDLQWNSKMQWFFVMIRGIWRVLYNRGKGLYRIVKSNICIRTENG